MSATQALLATRTAARASALPRPDMPVEVKLKILEAVGLAWEALLARAAKEQKTLETMEEGSVTTLLRLELNDRLDCGDIPGFTGSLFQHVIRDGHEETIGGDQVDKRPDLVFRLVNHGGAWPWDRAWFVECKIVDAEHGLSLYGQHGIRRFVEGEYAWTMPSALMLAYAGKGYEVRSLESWLAGPMTTRLHAVGSTSDPDLSTADRPVWRSSHRRDHLAYSGAGHGPGPLTLHHLWLARAPA